MDNSVVLYNSGLFLMRSLFSKFIYQCKKNDIALKVPIQLIGIMIY